MKKSLGYLLFFLFVSSCYYKPFVQYRLNKKGFKHFNKKEKFSGDNANPYRNYDVKKYALDLEVFPDDKKIAGSMTIDFVTTESQKTFMFDFKKGMKVLSYSTPFGKPSLKHKGDLLYLTYSEIIPKNKRIALKINYKGKPKNVIGEGPIQWKKDDKDRHWISSSTEGIGPHFMMPCNGLLKDEPDSTEINITVPNDLVVAANGKLMSVSENQTNQTKTYKHLVTNPINIYNISFNIGHFIMLKKDYTDLNGFKRIIECQVLDYNEVDAERFYDQAPKIMGVFEELYGVYPWWNDGCRFIESTFAAMEHQSGIAMGSEYYLDWKDYNLTLVHELSHEWSGNNVTAYDYCDAWIHEGLATYSEALFIEKVYGHKAYEKKIQRFYYGTSNKIPIRKVCGVKYSSWISYNDMDIYDKGALLMHSLRIVVDNDDLFFKALKTFQKDLAQSNITSDHFMQKFNNLLGNDYSALFNLYLDDTEPPILRVYTDIDEEGKKQYHYKWDKALPFELKNGLKLEVNDEEVSIFPTTTFQSIEYKSLKLLLPKSIYFLPKGYKK